MRRRVDEGRRRHERGEREDVVGRARRYQTPPAERFWPRVEEGAGQPFQEESFSSLELQALELRSQRIQEQARIRER